MPRFVRQLNRWLLFFILLALCAFPIQYLFDSKLGKGNSFFSFEMPGDDVVLMLYSNTARAGRYLIPIDESTSRAAPYTMQGETLVPARFLARNFDAEVSYDTSNGNITLASDERKIVYQSKQAHAVQSGKKLNYKLGTAPQMRDGIAYVPLRAASETFGRYIHVKNGLVLLSRDEDPPGDKQWADWKKELTAYLAYESFGPYSVEIQGHFQALFRTWGEAVAYARQAPGRSVKYRGQHAMFDPSKPLPKSFKLNGAPLILQLPELPRGCEVTVLAMLLQNEGVQVGKMDLAKKIKKDPSTFRVEGSKTYFGNPHDGFVGDMYSIRNPGLGVYHEPIAQLAESYLPGRVADITGTSFEHLLFTVAQGSPIWVIHTTLYDRVPASAWRTWQTPTGPIQVTYYEHSLLVTGYDEQYVYVHDPLGRKNKVEREAFRRGWEQMGSQAITILPKSE
ncbi:C39 family peptidase [Paenibacillus taiwanensis]|uniref:C39 family peptidase n=1 Tax=Paenibacillus taiwanensis TaxID=401638 RepID=UPI000425AEBB|nr:C39 family peptidase [Paenibacillus taiwanensis]